MPYSPELLQRRFLRRAIALARVGIGSASPNPPVGCVLVRDGKIVGEGYHRYAEKDHAEVVAVRQAGERARGATAYVSLEPCSQFGRTPPCADLLVKAGVRRVVVPVLDPNPEVNGRGLARLKEAGIQAELVQLYPEAIELVEAFACHVQHRMPLVVAKAAMSLDGKIALKPGLRTRITSTEAQEFAQRLRLQADSVLVGIRTVLSDDPLLDYRGSQPKARPLLRLVMDSRLRTPANARLFGERSAAPVLIFCAHDADASRRKKLERRGAEVVPVPRKEGGLDILRILSELGRRDVLSVLVEGGAEIHYSFLAGRHVDKFYFILAPLLFGGKQALPVVKGDGFSSLMDAPRFRIRSHRMCGPDLVVEAFPAGSRSILCPSPPEATPPSGVPDPGRS